MKIINEKYYDLKNIEDSRYISFRGNFRVKGDAPRDIFTVIHSIVKRNLNPPNLQELMLYSDAEYLTKLLL